MANIRVARRSGFVRRGGRMVRETLWGDVVATGTTFATAGAAVLINVTGAGLLALRPWTVIRARGSMFVKSDQTAAAEDQAIALGMAIVSDQAVAIGITAVPTPDTDAGSDLWFVYQTLMAAHGAGTVDSNEGRFIEYDSRAMRKVEDGSQLIVVGESIAAITNGLILRHQSRILIKLH